MPELPTASESVAVIAAKYLEGYETIKPLRMLFRARVEEAFALAQTFQKENTWAPSENKYYWMANHPHEFSLLDGNITAEGVWFKDIHGDNFLSFTEIDDMSNILAVEYGEATLRIHEKIVAARSERLARLKARVEEIETEISVDASRV